MKPIVIYGNEVLRKVAKPVDKTLPNLDKKLEAMWDTLYETEGCGLAAPQVNLSLQLFIVNSQVTYLELSEEEKRHYFEGDEGIKETFINAEIFSYGDENWTEGEGCLSIPGLYEPVKRPWSITLKYQDINFVEHIESFHGYTARVIQHEFDHTQGKLYIDRLSAFRKRLIQNKLKRILKAQKRK